jgi:outer membrane receptor protein involved in Fe transport
MAAPVGKIAGRVHDEKTGEPLAYANIVVEGTQLGAASDLDGEFFILNIPSGIYNVIASQVGYSSKKIAGVELVSEQTTRLDFALNPSPIEMEEVTVRWEKPPVSLETTSALSIVRRQTIEEMPTQTVNQILEIQAGATTDAAGQLHLRGGRAGEIGYYVDGQRLEDPVTGESFLFVNREAVEEISVLSGTFNAEYGDAMSGIVQVVTREGGDQVHADFEYLSPMINSSPYREQDWVRSGSDAVRDNSGSSLYDATSVLDEPDNVLPIKGRTQLTLSGPVAPLQNTTFFASSVMRNEDSHLPFGFEQERSLLGKIAYNYRSGGKIALSGGYGWENYQLYNHAWKYQPDHYHQHFVRDQHVELQWTHPLNRQSYINGHAGYRNLQHDIKIFEDWEDYIAAGYQKEDFTFAQYFFDENDWSDTYQESRTQSYSLGANASYQYGNHHLLKGGVEGRQLDIEMLDIRELEIGADGQPAGIIDSYRENPIEFAAFAQDKIELPYLVVNAGLRWDYYDPQSRGWEDPENPDSGLVQSSAAQQLSPRLGLAHPISETMSLYFAYGHFFQYPRYSNLFLNSADLNPDTLAQRSFDPVGNTALKPQRTVAYEVGLKGNLTPFFGFTITAYYKDITDLVGTKVVRVGTKYHYALFRNIDYASVVGMELGLRKTLSERWSFEGNYTYSVAKGNSSEPLQGFWNAYYEQPEARQEYYLDFDRRHVLNAMLIWQTDPLSTKSWLKALSTGINLGLVASWASGLPYTPYTGAGEQLALTNSARMDPTATVNVRFSKDLSAQPVKVTLLAYVENLFDATNDLIVNSQTGEPWEAPLESNEIAFDQIHDPSRVDVPRMIRVGLSAEF